MRSLSTLRLRSVSQFSIPVTQKRQVKKGLMEDKCIAKCCHPRKIKTLLEPRREKTGFCICENKDADQLRGNREAD